MEQLTDCIGVNCVNAKEFVIVLLQERCQHLILLVASLLEFVALLDKVELLLELFLLVNGEALRVGLDKWSWTFGRHRVRSN